MNTPFVRMEMFRGSIRAIYRTLSTGREFAIIDGRRVYL